MDAGPRRHHPLSLFLFLSLFLSVSPSFTVSMSAK